MAIHHSQIRQAAGLGFTLEESANGRVKAFHPSTATAIFGVSAKDAIRQMIAFLNINAKQPDARFRADPDNPNTGRLRIGETYYEPAGTPVELHRMFEAGQLREADEPESSEAPTVDATPLIKRSENGVPFDGAIAYKEGIMAAENPFPDGSDEAENWYAQWDQAADEAGIADEEGRHGGSVVSARYRTIYAERGHPNHCGDELANLLNNYCVGNKRTDLEMFERICELNGVDLSRYNRTTPGWQGRLRMTGRNLLAKKVYLAEGIIRVPEHDNPHNTINVRLSKQWLDGQRYKGKTNG